MDGRLIATLKQEEMGRNVELNEGEMSVEYLRKSSLKF